MRRSPVAASSGATRPYQRMVISGPLLDRHFAAAVDHVGWRASRVPREPKILATHLERVAQTPRLPLGPLVSWAFVPIHIGVPHLHPARASRWLVVLGRRQHARIPCPVRLCPSYHVCPILPPFAPR